MNATARTIALLCVAGCLCALILSVRAVVVCIPAMLMHSQNALLLRVDRLQTTVDALPSKVVPPVVAVAQAEIRHGVDSIDQRVGEGLSATDNRIGEAITAADARIGEVLQPVAALVKDAQDSWDDLYPDVRATVASATVATTSVALASESVRDAAPKVAESVVSVGQSSAAIAADVRREVDAITAPKKWWQKALGPAYLAGRLAAVFF